MDFDFCKKKVAEICDSFFTATGVPITVYLFDFDMAVSSNTPTCEFCRRIQQCNETHRACADSDKDIYKRSTDEKRTVIRECHANVLTIAVPILYDGCAVGFIYTYNMRGEGEFKMSQALEHSKFSYEKMKKLYDALPVIDESKAEGIACLLRLIAEYLVSLEIPIMIQNRDLNRLKDYIKRNLDKRLTVETVSRGTNISKSTIYRTFRQHLGCTLTEYINQAKIKQAEKLLVSTELSLDEVACSTGFSSTVYFRSVFKKLRGASPNKYRKETKKKRN